MTPEQKKTTLAGGAVVGLTAIFAAVWPREAEPITPISSDPPSHSAQTTPELSSIPSSREDVGVRELVHLPSTPAESVNPVGSHIARIEKHLQRGGIEGLTEAFRELRALRCEFGESDPLFEEIFSAVTRPLIDVTTSVCLQHGARGDFTVAGSLIGELHQLDIRSFAPNDEQTYHDFIQFSIAVLGSAGADPKSPIFKSLLRSADFSERNLNQDAQGAETVFSKRDTIRQYSENPFFERGRFIRFTEELGPDRARAYLGDAVALYQSQMQMNPRSALSGLCSVLGAVEQFGGAESEFSDSNRLATDSLLHVASAMLGPTDRQQKGTSISSPFSQLARVEQVFDDLVQFGVSNPALKKQLALIAHQSLSEHSTNEKVKRHWNELLERLAIEEPSLLF